MSSCQHCQVSYFRKKPIAIHCGHAVCEDCFARQDRDNEFGVHCKLCGHIDTSYHGVVSYAVIEALKEMRVMEVEQLWDRHGLEARHEIDILGE